MSRACSVCEHPARVEIERDLAAGASYRDTASRSALSKSAVERHWGGHPIPSEEAIMPMTVDPAPVDEARSRHREDSAEPDLLDRLVVQRADVLLRRGPGRPRPGPRSPHDGSNGDETP